MYFNSLQNEIFSLTLCVQLPLSYPIDQNMGRAKFDKIKKVLTVMLTVLPPSPSPPLSVSFSLVTELTNQSSDSESRDRVSHSGDESTNEITPSELTQDPSHITEGDGMALSPSNLTSPDKDSTNHNADNTSVPESHVTWKSRGDWSAPQYSYRQDNERVVFVVHSSHVRETTMVLHFDEHQVTRGGS